LSTTDTLTLLHEVLRPHYPIDADELAYVLTLRPGQQWQRDQLLVVRKQDRLFFRYAEPIVSESFTVSSLPHTIVTPTETIVLNRVGRPKVLSASGSVQYMRLPPLPLHLRPRKNGDRIAPLGMRGSRKVKDLLIDRKLPRYLRDRPLLLCTADEKIVAVREYAIDRQFAVTDDVDYVLRMETKKAPPPGGSGA
jgi:tRNA(Ile)-lysidine synthase